MFFPVCKDRKENDFAKDHQKLNKIAVLDSVILESSGLCAWEDGFLTINDGGNPAEIYCLDSTFKLTKTIPLPKNIKNLDWESITTDPEGNVYIGDCGNNFNRRKNLRILVLNKELDLTKVLQFQYPDQHDFPPEKEEMNFDVESLFYFQDRLYLFSKNRGDKTVKMYALNLNTEKQTAQLVDTIYLKGMITGASISESKKEFTLLSYGYIYTFSFQDEINFNNPKRVQYHGRLNQSEGITYSKNGSAFYITNEGGNVFKRD